MEGIIVYKSVYGSTWQYAEWIQQATMFDILPIEETGDVDWSRYHKLMMHIGVWIQRDPAVRTRMRHDLHRVVDGIDRDAIAPILRQLEVTV